MRRRPIFSTIRATCLCVFFAALASPTAADWPSKLGPQSGIGVLLGRGLGDEAVELARDTRMVVYVQSSDRDDVLAARQAAERAGMLGRRVFVGQGDGSRVHLADDLADVIVVGETARGKIPRNELLRALQPRGRLIEGEEVTIKPVPPGTGEWTHPYHGADNNPQSEDTLARAPYLTKFLATPWYGPMPQVTVSSGGRIFKAFGHLAFKRREWPMLGKLICLNAYNGTRLWERDLMPGFMIHRNTIVATADTLYVADNESCKVIDAATGKLRDEITVPEDLAQGPAWKWMTIQHGVLYALVGAKEQLHPVHRGTRTQTGWPWATVRSTYNPHQDSWGYGRTLLAMDLKRKRVLWSHREQQPVDSRAVCMAAGRIFIYSHENFLAAIDATDGSQRWRTTDAELLEAIGTHHRAQDPRLGYWTSSYAKCTADAVYFAGPQRNKLVAVSAADGELLWTHDDGNMQLILRDDGLYAMGRLSSSKKFDFLTGKVLADLQCFRGNCTRATGAADSILARGYRHTGTLRLDLGAKRPRRLASMRPACQDGVVVANGQLYWGPWMCDCNHSLVGVISLTSAADIELPRQASNQQRLKTSPSNRSDAETLSIDERDWPTYRANNRRFASSPANISENVEMAWTFEGSKGPDQPVGGAGTPGGLPHLPTAPVAAGGLIFFAGADGVVHAVDARSGQPRWKAYTGGAVRYPPAVWKGRVYVGSADGWVYCFAARSGKPLWRFLAAPIERKIPVYGQLSSTWPVASGVMVEDGVAYAAAGIVSHDGTHVYALDALSGEIKWQNNSSGSLQGPSDVVGVSVQGHLLYHDDKVYLAGGNVVSPAIYDAATGKCLNVLAERPETTLDDHWKMQRASRGSELFLVENQVKTAGRMLYSPRADGPASRYNANYFLQAAAGEAIIQGTNNLIVRVDPQRTDERNVRLTWRDDRFARVDAIVLCHNAALVAGLLKADSPDENRRPVLAALDPEDGKQLWTRSLPAAPVSWGLAVDRDGRIVVALDNATVACFAGT